MTTVPLTASPQDEKQWKLPDRGVVGMWSLIVAESAMFLIFVVAYIFYMGKSISGPTPHELLKLPIFITICLLSSSITVHLSANALGKGSQVGFLGWLLATILLGVIFLIGTGHEWYDLIYRHHFTVRTNLFGTTFYSLVGLHATHVVVGLLLLSIVALLALFGRVTEEHHRQYHVLTLYWHFVDGVWVVVFSVVYLFGR
jgi:cytochrome c oxidase subunit 3